MRIIFFLSCIFMDLLITTPAAFATQDPFPSATVPGSLAVTYNYGPEGKYPGGNDANFQKLAAAGFRLVRFLPDWQLIERTRGTYDFAYCDKIMALLAKHHLRPLISLGLTNHLYGVHYRVSTDEQRKAFGNFITALVMRYKGRHVIWELWNEPNTPAFWQPARGEKLSRDAAIQEFVAMAKAIVPIIRKIDPEALVVGPSAANYNTPWLYKAIKKEGLLSLLDGLSVHPYQPGNIPEKILRQHEQVKTWIPATDAEKPVLFTEVGYSAGTGKNEVTPDLQIAYLQRQYLLSLMLGARINAFYSMTDTDAREPCSKADHCYGFFTRYSNKEKFSLKAMEELVRALKGFTFKRRIPQPSDTTFVLEFASAQGKVRYAVWESVAPAPVAVTLPNDQKVRAIGRPVIFSQ